MIRELIFTFIAILSIGAGVWSILLVNRMHNVYKLNYLNTYLYCQILLFVFGLYGLIGMAIVDELLKEMKAPDRMVETIVNFLPYLGVPFLITAWYMFIKMSMEMVGRQIKGRSTIIYFTIMMMLLLACGIMMFFYYDVQSYQAQVLSYYIKLLFILVEIITFLIALYYLFIKGLHVKSATSRKMILNFAGIILVVKSISITLFFFAAHDSYLGAVYLLVFFSGNLPAIIYLDNYLNKNFLLAVEDGKSYEPYARFIADYNISKREWEIIEKICEGLTNKQISEVLFISVQTVKDHTHHIYKKTGIKNRVQLVNKVSDLNKNHAGFVI